MTAQNSIKSHPFSEENFLRAAQWIIPILLVTLWVISKASASFKLQLLPSPVSVIHRTVDMFTDGTLVDYVFVSARRAFTGLIIGSVLGYVLGMITGLNKTFNAFLNTTVQMLRTIPMLAYQPIMIIFLGIGDELIVFMVSMGVFFSMYLNTYAGVQGLDKGLDEMARVYGFTRREYFFDVVLPGSLPNVLVGVRIALGSMWMMLIAAESVSGNSGLGYMAARAREYLQMDRIFMILFIYAFFGKMSDTIATSLENYFLRWRKT